MAGHQFLISESFKGFTKCESVAIPTSIWAATGRLSAVVDMFAEKEIRAKGYLFNISNETVRIMLKMEDKLF